VFKLEHSDWETELCLPSEDRKYLYMLGPTEKDQLEDEDRIQYPKCCVLSKRLDDGKCPG
jgi:hypothetical protein